MCRPMVRTNRIIIGTRHKGKGKEARIGSDDCWPLALITTFSNIAGPRMNSLVPFLLRDLARREERTVSAFGRVEQQLQAA